MLCIRVDHRNFPISAVLVDRENCIVDVNYILFFENANSIHRRRAPRCGE